MQPYVKEYWDGSIFREERHFHDPGVSEFEQAMARAKTNDRITTTERDVTIVSIFPYNYHESEFGVPGRIYYSQVHSPIPEREFKPIF